MLHVYDLDSLTGKVNAVTRHLAQSGVFHVGVQVYGDEWSFGQHDDVTTGVTCNKPKEHFFHVYRESVYMGDTDLSRAEVWLLLERLKPEWPGNSYHLFQRNCITFADVLCHELGVNRVPEYVWRLPRHGAGLAEQIKTGLAQLREFDEAVGVSSGWNAMKNGGYNAGKALGIVQKNPQQRHLANGIDEDAPWPDGRDDYGGLPPPLPTGEDGRNYSRSSSFADSHDGGRGHIMSRAGNDAELIERMSRSSDAIPLNPSSARQPATDRSAKVG